MNLCVLILDVVDWLNRIHFCATGTSSYFSGGSLFFVSCFFLCLLFYGTAGKFWEFLLFHFSFAYHLGIPEDKVLQPGAPQEVSLSCGVTTDPSLWLLPPEDEEKEEQEEVEEKKAEEKLKTEKVLPFPTDSLLDQQERESAASSCKFFCDQYLEEEMKNEVEEVKDVKEEICEEQLRAEKTKEILEEETKEEQKPTKQVQWAGLVKAIVDTDQSLARFFYPLANRKTTQMLIEQLLCEDTVLMEEHYRRRKEEQEQQEEELEGKATPR